MRTIVTAIFILVLIAGVAGAEETNFTPKPKRCVLEKEPCATEPIGAIIETTGVIVGKILSATEIACTGERKIMVETESGECRLFPFCATTKVADKTFHAITFDQLKKGEKVKVDYTEAGGKAKANKVTIQE
jgi:hypothetical protein